MAVSYQYLIIGGGIAGVTAAEAIREKDPDGSIGIVSLEAHFLYSRVLLPSYLKGRIARDRVFLRSADDFARRAIKMHPNTLITRMDSESREAIAADGTVFRFDKLLISSGGTPRPWLHVKNQERIFRLQTIDDADRLLASIPSIHSPLIIGSSFIALELAEIFLHHGITPRILARDTRFFAPLTDEAGGAIMEQNFMRRGISCVFGDDVQEIAVQGIDIAVTTTQGHTIHTDALALGIGIERDTSFLASSAVPLGPRGINVDQYLESDIPGIFAAGDAAEYFDPISSTHRVTGNWTSAVLQGRHAGYAMASALIEQRTPFMHIPSYAIRNLGLDIAMMGDCDSELDSVTRVADTENSCYERIFLRDNTVAGAFLINNSKNKPRLMDAMSRGISLQKYIQTL